MDIDVVVFTPSAPVLHIQGHALHIYIMVDTTVPWFGPIRPIGCQGTQKVTGGTTTTTARGSRATGGMTTATGGKTMATGGMTTAMGSTTMARGSVKRPQEEIQLINVL